MKPTDQKTNYKGRDEEFDADTRHALCIGRHSENEDKEPKERKQLEPIAREVEEDGTRDRYLYDAPKNRTSDGEHVGHALARSGVAVGEALEQAADDRDTARDVLENGVRVRGHGAYEIHVLDDLLGLR
jgi:hypothetical protein